MTCQDARDRLSELLDGVLDDEARRSLDAHLGTCADCTRERDRLRATISLLHAVAPARAPAGFVDRVLAAAQPTPWYRRLLRHVILPWRVKLPIEAAAVVLVGVGVAFLWERTPELRDAARIQSSAPAPERSAPPTSTPAVTGTPAPSDARTNTRAETGAAVKGEARQEMEERKTTLESPRAKESADGSGAKRDLDQAAAKKAENATGRERDALGRSDVPALRDAAPATPPARSQLEQKPPPAATPQQAPPPATTAPQAPPPAAAPPAAASRLPAQPPAGESAPAERSAQGLTAPAAPAPAPRVLPRAELRVAKMRRAPDVAGRLAVSSRDDAERALRELATRHAGSLVDRQVEGDAVVLGVAVPRAAYPAFSRDLAALGRWTPEREPGDLPEVVQVTIRLE